MSRLKESIVLIPISERREAIDRLLEGGGTNEAYDAIGELEGIETLETRDWRKDVDKYKCAWFVFKDDDWWAGRDDFDLRFWIDTRCYLEERGYMKVDEPRDGDVVLYRYKGDLSESSWVKHFGIYYNGRVVSKFNDGHIFMHDLVTVPNSYGEGVIFMRKTERVALEVARIRALIAQKLGRTQKTG